MRETDAGSVPLKTPGVGKIVAVMQPYFFPYAGYFRLLQAADHFVIFDCVQFPRRGRVHRCEVPGPDGTIEWLTLPLLAQPRDVLIRDLVFTPDAPARLAERLARLPWLMAARGPSAEPVHGLLGKPAGSVVDFLEQSLRLVTEMLSLNVTITRSSALALDPALRGQDRVIAAAKAVGASCYVNAPGGRSLYRRQAFENAGLELRFLSLYQGRFVHLLPALVSESAEAIRDDIITQTILEQA